MVKAFCAWGVPIVLEGPRAAVLELGTRLPRGGSRVTRLDEPARFRWSAHGWLRGDEPTPDLEKAMELHVATRAPEHVFVHAGVVRFGTRALLLPGASKAGKSTLVRELGRRGGIYYSDEYAVLDVRGRVEAYPRPLSLRTGERIPARMLGWNPRLRAVPVGWVLDCRYTGRRSLAPLSRARAVLALFAHAVAAQHKPAQVLSLLGLALGTACCVHGTREGAPESADWILDWVGREGKRCQTPASSAKAVEPVIGLAT